MIRRRNPPKDPHAVRNIGVHPALYAMLAHQAIDEGQTLQERLHFVLCHELGRMDLLVNDPEPAQSA
jgi:hypothetical protein